MSDYFIHNGIKYEWKLRMMDGATFGVLPNETIIIERIYYGVTYAAAGDGDFIYVLATGTDENVNYLIYVSADKLTEYNGLSECNFVCKEGTLPTNYHTGSTGGYFLVKYVKISNYKTNESGVLSIPEGKMCNLWKFITQGCEF